MEKSTATPNPDLAKYIRQLRAEIYTLTHTNHQCSKSTLIQCCEQQRCEVCHIEHMLHCHTSIERNTWWRFYQSTWLLPPSVAEIKERVAEKKAIVKKQRKEQKIATTLDDTLSIGQIEEMLRELKGLV